MRLPDFLLFASDATIVGIWGAAFLLLALFALLAEWRRERRKNIDRVGLVPWSTIFVLCAFVGAGLLVTAVKGWLTG
jgi:apolipoprotein N-acyltransferase